MSSPHSTAGSQMLQINILIGTNLVYSDHVPITEFEVYLQLLKVQLHKPNLPMTLNFP
jgi:hypothetical protein